MILYFAGGLSHPVDAKLAGVKNVLSSWLEKKEQYYNDFNVLLDSGAFSAYTLGVKIDLQEYIDYIKQWKLKDYASLDVIGDAEATKQNGIEMQKQGLIPIPCFHFGEDYDYLRFYCEHYDYIALGGVAQLGGGEKLRIWLDNCFSVIKEYWPKKVHGFAVSAAWALMRYPFYSVDSTSWLVGGKFGRLVLFDNLELKGMHYTDRMALHKFQGELNNMIDKPGRKGYRSRNVQTIKTYLKLEQFVNKVWQERGVVWN